MEKSCEMIEEMLIDYTDGQLSQDDSKKVDEHLEKCRHCRRILGALNKSLDLAGAIWEDGLKETEEIRAPIPSKTRKNPWPKYVAAAAGIMLMLTTSILWRALIRPQEKALNFADIERSITEAGNAARLLAATELLTEYPDAQSIVKDQYRYIVETYPETSAAEKVKLKTQ